MWKDTTLGEYYDVRDGTHDSPQYVEDGYPLVTSKNLKNGKIDLSKIKYISEKDYQHINKRSGVDVGDVLMAMIGTIGNPVEIIEPPKFAIKNVALFKTNTQQSPAYLRYFLSHPDTVSKMMSDAKGTTQKFVGLGYLRNFPISVPPLAEQQRIVAKLDAAFAEIDNEIRLCKQNIDNSNTLFNSQLDYIFNNKNLSKSKEWIKSLLKDLCNNFKADIVDGPFGSNLKKSDYIDRGTEVLKIQNIKPFYINNKKMSFVSKKKYHELKRHSFASGDIIMTKLGEPLGVSAIVEDLKKGLIVADLVRIRAAKINTKFLCYQLNSPSINRYINSQQTGSGRKRIRLSVARELPIAHPSMEVQHEIVKSLDKIKNDIESLSNIYNLKLNNLESLKSSILNQNLCENIKGNAA